MRYDGDDNFTFSTISLGAITINKANTSISVATSKSSFTYGETLTATATITVPAPGVAPTSSVTFTLDNGTQRYPNIPITNGTATLTIPAPAAGQHTISASYAGDSNYNASTSQPITVTVGKATLTVRANDATKVYGAALPTFAASYSGFVGGDNSGTLTGAPTFTTAAAVNSPVGSYAITPAAGTLSAVNYTFAFQNGRLTVTQAATSTALTSSPNPSIPGESITLRATVTSAAGTPDGQVEFFDGGASLGKVSLAGGVGVPTLPAPQPLGSRSFTASYLGSTNFSGSASSAVTHVVRLPCEITLNPSGRGFTETGGSFTERVTVSGSCNWEATSNAAWVTVTGYSVSSGTVDYTVAPLTAGVERTGTITVGNQTFTVFQKKTVVATSGATFLAGDVAAEQFVTAFGAGLTYNTAAASSLPLPTSLGGIEVRVRDSQGAERLAPLFYVSPTQVNYLIPKFTASGAATVTFRRDGQVISTANVSVTSLSPGIFTAPQTGSGPAAALVQRINGANVTYEQTARYDPLAARFVALPISLTGSDQSFLLLFGTGVRGVTSRNIITATVGGVPVDVTYVGAQGQYEGLDQLNLRLLPSLAGKSLVDVKINVDGQPLNTVQINLQ